MKRVSVCLSVFGWVTIHASVSASVSVPNRSNDAQFTSTVQWAIHESNSQLIRRAQKLVIQQFAHTIDEWPELRGRHYEVETRGNEVALVISTEKDVREPFRSAALQMVDRVRDRVWGSGRISFYRTSLERPLGGYFNVVVDDRHSQLVSVCAQSVPLRDLLRELKTKIGLSYLIPGECAERMVDWSFGEGSEAPGIKAVPTAMSEIAALFGLKSENRKGTYIFTGTCAGLPVRPAPPFRDRRSAVTPVVFSGRMPPTQVSLSLPPLLNY